MQRSLLLELNQWVNSKNRKPLVLRGARQVGKSTAVRMAAKSAGRQLVELNLEKFLRLNEVFGTLDLKKIIPAIEFETRCRIVPESCLLFLDEIQATPNAIAALRYFYEELPVLPVIAAGSLLEMVLGQIPIKMPVGRIAYHHVGPLSFEEFLAAKNESFLLDKLACFEIGSEWPAGIHEHGLALVREFMMVGGMPAAVHRRISNDERDDGWLQELQSIVDTFKDDFAKYTHRAALLPVLQQVYDLAPRFLAKTLTLKDLAPGVRHEYIKEAVTLLTQARVILLAKQNDASGIPLSAGAREKSPKTFWLDIGLINRMQNIEASWLGQNFSMVHAGQIAEQFVAQHLQWWHGPHLAPSLYHWVRGGKTNSAEVDFVVQAGQHIIPIEVKSGAAGSLRSLHQFLVRGDAPFGLRLDMDTPRIHAIDHEVRIDAVRSRRLKTQLLSLPLYMIGQVKRLVDRQLS